MKRFIILFIVFLTALASLLFFYTKHIKIDKIQDQVVSQINQALGENIQIGQISWKWRPYPVLSLEHVRSSMSQIDLNFPEIQILPDWRTIVYDEFTLGRVKLIDPVVTLKTAQKGSDTPFDIKHISDSTILIQNGTLLLTPYAVSDTINIKKSRINRIDATIKILATRFKFDVDAAASFCSKISIRGRVDLKNRYYRLATDYTKLNINKLLHTANSTIHFLSTPINTSAHIEGVTLNNFKMQVKGELPSFKLQYDKPFLISSNSYADLAIERYDNDFFLNIDTLNLNSPSMILNGGISRRQGPTSSLPIWTIDLNGKSINLNHAREMVLSQWGQDDIAKDICDVVKGGKAKSARYYFQGSTPDFEYLKKMKIWVDVEKSDIYIPDIKLSLNDTSGKISILDGNLSGKNLRARTGKSVGTKGSILLDLKEKGDAFNLDLDLDVDLSDLKTALVDIVTNESFQSELSRFHQITGRARGHLSLKDSLNDIKTFITVKEASGSCDYNRIPWRINLHSAFFKISPDQTNWEQLIANTGPINVSNASGSVVYKDTPYIQVSSLSSTIESNIFLESASLEVNGNRHELKDYIPQSVEQVKGVIALSNVTLSGLADDPAKWQYDFNFASDFVEIQSELLDSPVTSTNIKGVFNNQKTNFRSTVSVLSEIVDISSTYFHNNFRSWHGTSELSGILRKNHVYWLKDKSYLPPGITPRYPLHVDHLTIATEGTSFKNLKITGLIKPIAEKDNEAKLNLSVIKQKKQTKILVEVVQDDKYGKLAYNNWLSMPTTTLLTWQGNIDAASINKFLIDQPLQQGTIAGVFNILNTENQDLAFTGYLQGSSIKWKNARGIAPYTVKDFKIAGEDKHIKLINSDVQFGEDDSVVISGSILPTEKSTSLDLQLSSNEVLYSQLKDVIYHITGKKITDGPSEEEFIEPTQTHGEQKEISGTIKYAVDQFVYDPETSSSNDSPTNKKKTLEEQTDRPLILAPIDGAIEFSSVKNEIQLEVSQSKICGLEMNGQFTIDNNGQKGSMHVLKKDKLSFKETLPCLNVKQSIIDGDFTMQIDVDGYPGNWQKGEFTLESSDGVIRKMDLLSKVFSIINFTELVTFRDLPHIDNDGLQYNEMIIKGHIDTNKMIIDRASLKGKGLNLSAQGSMNLRDMHCDLTFFVAPFKMIDSVITSIPLVGRIIGGKKGAILTFPVKVEGPVDDPSVTPLSPTAIGKATFEFIADTLSLPFAIFTPFMDDEKEEKRVEPREQQKRVEKEEESGQPLPLQ